MLLVRQWSRFWDDDLDAADRQLALQVALFLLVPLGVFLHELGHALATRSVDGRVVEFAWRVYWGFVVSAGVFSPAARWWIAFSGNLVGIVFGLALLVAGYRGRRLRRPVRFLLIQAGTVQLLFAAVAYPLLSVAGAEGDWKTIYDFASTPLLSGLTAAAHAALLIGLWAWRRTGRPQETLFAIGYGAEDEVDGLRAAIDAAPAALAPRLAMARAFMDHGRPKLAEATLRRAVRACGETATVYDRLGASVLAQGRFPDATIPLLRGLELDPAPEEGQRLWANLGIALTGAGRNGEAVDAFAHLVEPMASDPVVVEWRTRARAAPSAG